MHARHHCACEVRRPAGVLHLGRTRRVVVIENDELKRNLCGKLRYVFRPPAERCACVRIDSFQVVEKSRCRNVPRNPEARSVRDRAVRLQKEAAFVIENVFLVIWLWSAGGRNRKADTGRKKPRRNKGHDKHTFRLDVMAQDTLPNTLSLTPNRRVGAVIFL